MRKFIQQKLKDQKGLTLIELLAVIVILAIIAAIAIPAIGNIIENSRVGASKSDASNVLAAADLYLIDNPRALEATGATITSDDLIDGGYLDDLGGFEGVAADASATPPVLASGGSITSVTKDATTGDLELKAKAVIGGVEVDFDFSPKQEINALPNSTGDADGEKLTGGTITVTR